MKLTRLERWLEDLYVEYKCDPTILYLSAESQVELTTDILDDAGHGVCDMGLTDSPLVGGAIVTKVHNHVTGTVIDIERSELPLDYVLTTLCLIEGKQDTTP